MPPSDNDFIEPSDLDHDWEQHVYTDVGAFAMIPLWFLRKKPSDRAVHLMAVMLAEFGSATKNMWPSVKTLMEMTGASESSVRRSFKELQDLGVLRVESRTRPNGSSTSNAYHFRLTDPRFWEGGVPPLTPHGGSTTDTPRSISSKRNIGGATATKPRSGPRPLSDDERAKLHAEFGAMFPDLDNRIEDILAHGGLAKWKTEFNPVRNWLRGDAEKLRQRQSSSAQRNGYGSAPAGGEVPPLRFAMDSPQNASNRGNARPREVVS